METTDCIGNVPKLTKDNDFTLTITGFCMVGSDKIDVDLNMVENMTVTITGAPNDAYSYSVDEQGRLVLEIDGPKLDIKPYGLIASGTVQGRDWCWRVRKILEIVRYTCESNTTNTTFIEAECAPAGVEITLIESVDMPQAEYDALTEKDNNMIYLTY